jgi:hypothetical protein
MIALLAVAALLTGLFAPGSLAAQTFTVRPVVTAGQSAPGGGTFEHFSVEALPIVAPPNARGQVAFFASLLRGAGGEGLFLASGSGITKVTVEGDPAPGGGTISGLGRHPVPALNADGTVAFAASVAKGKTVEGIFTASRGRIQAVALAGAVAPGIASGTLAGFDAPALNDRGDVAFTASVRRGRETVEAIYFRAAGRYRAAGTLTKLVAQGDPAPAGGVFAAFGPPALNNQGSVVFAAVIEGRAVPGGIFRAQAGQLKTLVGAGDDTPLGGIFMKFSERLAINDAGLVAFQAVLRNGPVAAAVFVVDNDVVRKVAATGDGAPGGGTFSHFGPWPALDAAGTVGFVASVDAGPSPVGAFLAGSSGLSKVAAIGDPLPGGGTLATFTLYPVITLSPSGSLTFAAAPTATGQGVEGIYLATPSR